MAKSSKPRSAPKKTKASIELNTSADDLIFGVGVASLKPEAKFPVSEWADAFRVLSPVSSAEAGPWRTSRTPYAREIMDMLSSGSPAQRVIFMKASQIGGTEIGLNWLGYIADMAPGPTLYVVPNESFAKDYSRLRITPMIEESERLKSKISEAKSRDSGNTIMRKEFPGGYLAMTGANVPSNLRGKPIRYLFMDELDEFPGDVGGQGDPVELAITRTRTFSRRKKIYAASSPTIAGRSRIEKLFEESDKRYFFVPCTSCGHMQRLVWSQIKWVDREPNTAVYECEKCQHHMREFEKTSMLANGEWRATQTAKNAATVGYHLSALYSPPGMFSWAECVESFLKSKEDRLLLKVFVNTILGEVFEERGDAPDWEILSARKENYPRGLIPSGGYIITAGVDIQKDRAEVEIVAWGSGKTSWSVDYRIIDGAPEGFELWERLDKLLLEEFAHEEGGSLPIHMLAVDSGAFTQYVYDWARRHPPGRVMAVKGMDSANQILMTPKFVDVDIRGKRIPNGVRLWGVGVSIAKMELYTLLRLPKNEDGTYPAGFVHFPSYDDVWFKQLTAESLVQRNKKGGGVDFSWVLPPGKRAEALDCRVYARAAAAGLSVDRFTDVQWDRIREEFNSTIKGDRRIQKQQKRDAPAPPRMSGAPSGMQLKPSHRPARGLRADWHDPD